MNIRVSLITLLNLLVILFLSVGSISASHANGMQCQSDIKTLLKSYETALNANRVATIVGLYATNGVFMPAGKPTAKGQAGIKKAYRKVFDDLDLNVNFNIKKIEWHGNLAFVRTVSGGQIKLRKKNQVIANHTRELFVLKRIDGQWKIYQYMFNAMSTAKL